MDRLTPHASGGVHIEPSPAISNLLDTLSRMARDYKSPAWDYVLINGATLFRNNISKERNLEQCITEGGYDSLLLENTMRQYWARNPKSPKNPEIIMYLPDYSAIPLLHRRPESKTTLQVKEMVAHVKKFLLKEHPDGVSKTDSDIAPTVTLVAGDVRMYPHQAIYNYIMKSKKSESKMTSFFGFNQLNIVMLSHCPIDWHLAFMVKQFHLMESYTGNLKGLSVLGEKLFKEPFIPFNRATHLLFGDSVHIKGMAQRKNKKLILDVAQKQRWYAKSEASIITDISQTLAIPKQILTNVKF